MKYSHGFHFSVITVLFFAANAFADPYPEATSPINVTPTFQPVGEHPLDGKGSTPHKIPAGTKWTGEDPIEPINPKIDPPSDLSPPAPEIKGN